MSYFSFYPFSSAKSENRRAEQVLPSGWVGTSVGEGGGKGGRKVSTVQKMCTNACKFNNDTCCNYSMNGGGRMKGNGRGSEFKYDIVDTL
jgi:hypothetical protein